MKLRNYYIITMLLISMCGVINCLSILFVVILKCYFSGEHTAKKCLCASVYVALATSKNLTDEDKYDDIYFLYILINMIYIDIYNLSDEDKYDDIYKQCIFISLIIHSLNV